MMIIKRILVFSVFVIICTACLGQKVIFLKKQGGVYTIPCSINGIKRSLFFDTGASTVTISMNLAKLLYNSGKLSDSDIKGAGKSLTASGQIVNNLNIVLRDVEISGLHLKNIDAVVIEGQNVPLLFGLSAIQKLGKVTLSGNKLIVDTSIKTNAELSDLRNRINSYIIKDQYEDALNLLKQIESQDAAEEKDIYNLAYCYSVIEDFNKSLMYCQQWMGTYKDINSSHEPDICYFMGVAYKGLKNHYEADKWFSMAISQISLDAIERTRIDDALTLSYYYNQKALNYLEGKAYDHCVEAFDFAAQYRIRYLGYTMEDLCKGRIKDDKVGTTIMSISKIYAVYLNKGDVSEHYAILAALCGNKDAIDFCEHFHLDYSPRK